MTPSPLALRLASIEHRLRAACVRAGRLREDVLLVAVVKQRPLEAVRELHALGERHFGENRVQEIRERVPELAFPDAHVHFIGHLQTNKAKYLPGLVQWVHSVDSLEVAEALNRAWEKHPCLPMLNVLVQVNIAGEEQKSGVEPAEAEALVRATAALPRLALRGLMTMAPYGEETEASRPVFRGLRTLRDRLATETGIALPDLSMGMTGDFEVAVEEGSTLVRVGTALFE